MSDDLVLQQRVIDELEFEPAVNAAHIGIAVHDGVVTLSGHVSSYLEKHEAERTVRRIKGVKAIAQELEVRLPGDKQTADDEIAARAVKILGWDAVVPDERIAVRVEHGVVTLSGEVDWAHQRAAAERDVRRLGGVKNVINSIVIAPIVEASDVKAKIRAALERYAEVEAGNIDVAVVGGAVTLTGRAATWSELDAVERAAWSVPGVTRVEDRIHVARS